MTSNRVLGDGVLTLLKSNEIEKLPESNGDGISCAHYQTHRCESKNVKDCVTWMFAKDRQKDLMSSDYPKLPY